MAPIVMPVPAVQYPHLMHIAVVHTLEPTDQQANSINMFKMAGGFAEVGHTVTIVCQAPPAGPLTEEELRERYHLPADVRWIQLCGPCRGLSLKKLALFEWAAMRQVCRLQPDLVYTRNFRIPHLASKRGMPSVVETHISPEEKRPSFHQLLADTTYPEIRTVVTISHRLAEGYQRRGVPAEKILVLPDAVDLSQFQRPVVLPASPYTTPGPHITYTGHLYDYKGVPTVIAAAKELPEATFHLVGGNARDIARQQALAEQLGVQNVIFHGMQRYADVPPYVWHADVLLLPPSAKHESAAWTSPMKLGEYLAAGVPILATDITALRDWLTDDDVEFVPPDNPSAMAAGIRRVLTTPRQTNNAHFLTFRQRCEAILQAAFPSEL